MTAQAYLDAIKLKLATSPIIKEADVAQERNMGDRGFFRARLGLVNTDFVEVAEFFVIDQGQVRTVEYRYQWMDASKQRLRRRWDNATHHPGLPNFPHHIHMEDEKRIESGVPMSVVDLVDYLEQILAELL